MLKKLSLILSLSLICTGQVMACAGCMGNNPNDRFYLWIVGIFVLIIYFPMFYLFKTFKKYKNINNNDIPKA
ncbi:MAG: hypothetical protein H7336_06885 [Bacteriovorax sp.]|nr:hypothetical protein [Bacteriovorax sp.]